MELWTVTHSSLLTPTSYSSPKMKFPRQFATLMFFLAVVNHWHLFHCNRSDAKQPNIVWIVSEDNSIHYLNHFFPGGAVTPISSSCSKRPYLRSRLLQCPCLFCCTNHVSNRLLWSSHWNSIPSTIPISADATGTQDVPRSASRCGLLHHQ